MEHNYFLNKFYELSDLINDESARVQKKFGDKIKCGRGCSLCCHQIFRITYIDAFVIKDHLEKIPADRKKELKEKALVYLQKKNHSSDEIADFSVKAGEPCPALNQSGECMIYEARPVICRRFGPPLYDYKNPTKIFACELNFRPGEKINDNGLIPAQTLIGKKWDELKTEFNEHFNVNKNASTTIAEALSSK